MSKDYNLKILGSGSCNLVDGRNASSILLQGEGGNILYDIGRGIASQLVKVGLKQDDITTIILSHLHPDHVTDLIPYLQAATWSSIDKRTKDLHIYGQPGTKKFVEQVIELFGGSDLIRGFEVIVHELSLGKMTLQGMELNFVDLNHAYGFGFSCGDRKYAVMGDSSFHETLVKSLASVELGIFDAGHLSTEEMIELSVQSQAKKLVCSHHYDELDEQLLNQRAKDRGYSGELIVANDLSEFKL